MSLTKLQARLIAEKDPEYQRFQSKLIPTVAPDRIIGVRIPILRKIANEFARNGAGETFLRELPHLYFEEYLLHSLLISDIKELKRLTEELERFLPYVDNWAVCDSLRPKIFRKNRDKLLCLIPVWLSSHQPYTIRFGLEMLMLHYLQEDFSPMYLDWAASVTEADYYVRMMVAWFFATALTHQYEAAVVYLEQRKLTKWIHNKSIQKAVESFRISAERKVYLKTLRQNK